MLTFGHLPVSIIILSQEGDIVSYFSAISFITLVKDNGGRGSSSSFVTILNKSVYNIKRLSVVEKTIFTITGTKCDRSVNAAVVTKPR